MRSPKTTSENQGWGDKFIISAVCPKHIKLLRKHSPEGWLVLKDECTCPVDHPADSTSLRNTLTEILGLRQFHIATTQQTLTETQEFTPQLSPS